MSQIIITEIVNHYEHKKTDVIEIKDTYVKNL